MTMKHEQNHEQKYEQKYEQKRERNREKDHKQNHEQNRTMHETGDSATPSLDSILSTKPHEPNLLERVEEAEAPLDTRVEKLLVRLAHVVRRRAARRAEARVARLRVAYEVTVAY